MLSKHIRMLVTRSSVSAVYKRTICCSNILYKKKRINPILRTWNVLKGDFQNMAPNFQDNELRVLNSFPSHTDILVIGGGIMGTSVAYWLREKSGVRGVNVTVVEKDPTFSKSSTVLSVGGLRQQFSLPENIQMSLYGAEFLRTIKERFGPDADVCFTPNGYLTLAGEDGAHQLLDNHKLQKSLGANNIILNKVQLKEKFPWMNVDGIELGCLGIEKEGWFDPWSLLNLMKKGATELGTRFIHGEVTEFLFAESNILVSGDEEGARYVGSNEVVIKLPSGEEKTITFSVCVIATGSETNEIAKLAGIGTGKGILSVPVPVEKRKRYVYKFACRDDPPGINTPMTIDKTGTYFRRECIGGTFICGLSPSPEDEPQTDNLDVDYDFFDKSIWPILAERVPAFNCLKRQSGWSGYYDYNYYDQNGIIGIHPYYHNFLLATGFSGHGIQQAPAVGRAIAELILDGKFQTIDLTRLGFDRLIVNKPMYEVAIF
ncbi:FAD-dependent oxidoreductase domain-containing protein 1 isoform X2 [Coccinella septempunctata]|uniref:FAD-dependent oxidoreductase domain-containing protein 1 isoform X2 n=1 Tax=Coccinella septempunctata TaxID=41139 RepID=UPI001D08CA4E|nr:FAD-dependent oxidoreductase domain-containing protein 1 isoform X2 [Coccinella septempunctata]